MGMGGNGNIRFSKIFPLSWVSYVAYDSASFAAMHFFGLLLPKKLSSCEHPTEYGDMFICLLNCVCNCICKFIRMEQYATGGNGNS